MCIAEKEHSRKSTSKEKWASPNNCKEKLQTRNNGKVASPEIIQEKNGHSRKNGKIREKRTGKTTQNTIIHTNKCIYTYINISIRL